MIWRLRTQTLTFDSTPKLMGILNVTPDSFSDGGKYVAADSAIAQALQLQADGADIIDIGAESTRPYSSPVSAEEQIARLRPVLQALDRQYAQQSDQQSGLRIPVSIDTQSAAVAEAALKFDCVQIINDVSGLEGDPQMLGVARDSKAGVCVMHMQGTPQTMQNAPRYQDVVQEIRQYLQDRFDACIRGGIEPERICLDPGIGFGKTHEHNLTLLRGIHAFLDLPAPILVGHSRKGFIAHVLGDKTIDRDAGTLGVSLAMAAAGVPVLRVHNVALTRQALTLFASSRKPPNHPQD